MYLCANVALVRFPFCWKVLDRSAHHHTGEWRQPEGSLLLPGVPLHRAAEWDILHLLSPLHYSAMWAQHLHHIQSTEALHDFQVAQGTKRWSSIQQNLLFLSSTATQQEEKDRGGHDHPGEHHWAVGAHSANKGKVRDMYVNWVWVTVNIILDTHTSVKTANIVVLTFRNERNVYIDV